MNEARSFEDVYRIQTARILEIEAKSDGYLKDATEWELDCMDLRNDVAALNAKLAESRRSHENTIHSYEIVDSRLKKAEAVNASVCQHSEELVKQLDAALKRIKELEAKTADMVPRSRYDVACDQYVECEKQRKILFERCRELESK